MAMLRTPSADGLVPASRATGAPTFPANVTSMGGKLS